MNLEIVCEKIDEIDIDRWNDMLLIECAKADIGHILDQIGKEECLAYWGVESE